MKCFRLKENIASLLEKCLLCWHSKPGIELKVLLKILVRARTTFPCSNTNFICANTNDRIGKTFLITVHAV